MGLHMSIEVNNLLVNPNFFNSIYPLIFIKTSSLHTKNYNLEEKEKKNLRLHTKNVEITKQKCQVAKSATYKSN